MTTKTIDAILSEHNEDTRGPRPIEQIEKDVRDLLLGDLAKQRETAKALADLHKEAKPFSLETRVTDVTDTVQATETATGVEIHVDLVVVTQDTDERTENQVPAHPTVAAAFWNAKTQSTLIDALEKADRAGHWKLAGALAKALQAAYGTLDIYEHNERPVEPKTFRLSQLDYRLEENIKNAYQTANVEYV